MTAEITGPERIERFLRVVGDRCAEPAALYLFGGSALLLLGGGRHTGDVDYTLGTASSPQLRDIIAAVAAELDLDVEESIPEEFMPLPAGADDRHRLIGQFRLLTAYVFDPYSIAVMKTDRLFKTDLQDVQFMLRSGIIEWPVLAQCVEDVAARYDEPLKLRRNFEELRRSLQP